MACWWEGSDMALELITSDVGDGACHACARCTRCARVQPSGIPSTHTRRHASQRTGMWLPVVF